MKNWIVIHTNDNVAVALSDLDNGSIITVDGGAETKLLEPVLKGHKVSLGAIPKGAQITKYGAPIGIATQDIRAGEWVHSHNMVTTLNDANEYQYSPAPFNLEPSQATPISIFRRESGQVAIRNELWVIPTVGCVNGIAKQIVDEFLAHHACEDIDGVFHFPHQFGCSQLGDDHEMTKTLLQKMALHPNAGGVLVIGLGCENNQISAFRDGVEAKPNDRIRFLVSQTEDDEVAAGVQKLNELYATMRRDKREAGTLSEIRFGLECGGSDGLSGITANPLIGRFSDFVIRQGGSTVLTEVPEMFGAETLLMNRCDSTQTYGDVVDLITAFKDYYKRHNQPIYENPSPGNKKGGITTLEEKSLGCTQKSGSSAVVSVLNYGEVVHTPGLSLLNAPGNDAIATSALGASGCHMVLFSTGRGTPYGGFVPTLKIATNSELAQKKKHWIDFDAGRLVADQSFDDALNDFVELIVRVVNGAPVKNENNNMREVAIWKNGVTL